ncbi:MAG: hypothetical protein GY861_06435 [bacterium]|nr:hypothetical protein [bacterium]
MVKNLSKWLIAAGLAAAVVFAFVDVAEIHPALSTLPGIILLVLGFIIGWLSLSEREGQSYILIGLGLFIVVKSELLNVFDIWTTVVSTIGVNVLLLVSAGILAVVIKMLARKAGF